MVYSHFILNADSFKVYYYYFFFIRTLIVNRAGNNFLKLKAFTPQNKTIYCSFSTVELFHQRSFNFK